MEKATHVLYYATRFGYYVASYTDDGQPVKEYRAGNHPGDSQGYMTPKRRYEPGEIRPVKLPTLRKWARESAIEIAKEAGIDSKRIGYDQDSADDETEMLSQGIA